MRPLRSLSLEGAVRSAIPLTVLVVAFGSNWSPSVRHYAQPLWHVLLVMLAALAVAFALTRAGRGRIAAAATPVNALAGVLVAVALASTGWSVALRTTLERGVSFALVVLIAVSLAYAALGDRRLVDGLLEAVLAGGVAVALAGLVVLAVSPHHAVQTATQTIPARYRGIGENPNTDPMLWAATLPLAAWATLRRTGRARILAAAAVVLLAGSVAASGSRGALVTAVVATLAALLVAARTTRARLAAAAVVIAGGAVAVGVSQLPQPNPNATDLNAQQCALCTHRPNDADAIFRLEDELGNPQTSAANEKRTLFARTGRTTAWRGAVDQGKARPVAGYGFGTDDRVFADRFYSFSGGSPENSFVDVFLELGLAGVLVFVALAVALAAGIVRAVREAGPEARGAVAAAGAVFLAGLMLAVVQSYLFSSGNNAMLSVWVCTFLALAAVPARPPERR